MKLTLCSFSSQLLEYFHLVNFVRPNVLGHNVEARFDREYAKPITKGMSSNVSAQEHCESLEKSRELHELLEPYVHRVDSSELRKHLPPMQQVVLHVRQTRMQSKFYRAYKRYQKNPGPTDVNYNNFLKQYASLRPIHNHPVSVVTVVLSCLC
jgi:SNF2 family DNA or RNA helicase